jgi:hypothetical protein
MLELQLHDMFWQQIESKTFDHVLSSLVVADTTNYPLEHAGDAKHGRNFGGTVFLNRKNTRSERMSTRMFSYSSTS